MTGVFYDSLLRSKGGKYYPISNLDSCDFTELLPWLLNNCWYFENGKFFIFAVEMTDKYGVFYPSVCCISKLHKKGVFTKAPLPLSIKGILFGESSVIVKFDEQNEYSIFVYDEIFDSMLTSNLYYFIDNEIQNEFERDILLSSSLHSILREYQTMAHLTPTTMTRQGTSAWNRYNKYKYY